MDGNLIKVGKYNKMFNDILGLERRLFSGRIKEFSIDKEEQK